MVELFVRRPPRHNISRAVELHPRLLLLLILLQHIRPRSRRHQTQDVDLHPRHHRIASRVHQNCMVWQSPKWAAIEPLRSTPIGRFLPRFFEISVDAALNREVASRAFEVGIRNNASPVMRSSRNMGELLELGDELDGDD